MNNTYTHDEHLGGYFHWKVAILASRKEGEKKQKRNPSQELYSTNYSTSRDGIMQANLSMGLCFFWSRSVDRKGTVDHGGGWLFQLNMDDDTVQKSHTALTPLRGRYIRAPVCSQKERSSSGFNWPIARNDDEEVKIMWRKSSDSVVVSCVTRYEVCNCNPNLNLGM